MLKSINTFYLLLSVSLYIVLSLKISGEYLLINFSSILSVISYYFILKTNFYLKNKFYKRKYLSIEVFIYSFVFIFFNNIISYYYNSNFFLFSEFDANFYHEITIKLLSMPLLDAIKHYLSIMPFEDLGMILILYPLYHIVESNLILNFFYMLVGVITALSLFKLSQNFMSKKYAFLSAITYSLSSFVLFFHSIGLKESFMVMLVVLSFDYYHRSINKKNIIYLIYSLIFISLIMLFRPAVSAIIIASIGLGVLLSKQRGYGVKFFSFLILISLVLMSNDLLIMLERYTGGGVDKLIQLKEAENMIKGGVYFTYAVNILAQAIGPLPTLISSEKTLLTFYAPGLIYRVLLSIPFWLGVVYIIKTKTYKLYPLTIFVILEMFALLFLLEGLELRKALPHIPIVFLIAFCFLDNYDNQKIKFKKIKRIKYFFKISLFILAILILYWNFK